MLVATQLIKVGLLPGTGAMEWPETATVDSDVSVSAAAVLGVTNGLRMDLGRVLLWALFLNRE